MSKKISKILLVDDDEMLRKTYEMQFESYPQYELITADNIRKAGEILEQSKPDLILLDLILGKEPATPLSERDKIEGFNFLTYLKLEKDLQDIPVIIFSNLDNRVDMDRARRAGAEDYLVKTNTLPSETMQRIKDVLELTEAKTKVISQMKKMRQDKEKL